MATYKAVWCIQADSGKPGDSILVVLKSGKTKTVTLGAEIQPGIFLPVEDAAKIDTSAQGFKEAFGSKAYQERKARGAAVIEALHAAHEFPPMSCLQMISKD